MAAIRILISIPLFNEEKFIGDVLRKIHATAPNIPILVVNDGSKDASAEIVRQFDVFLIEHKQNFGKGEAIKTAFSFARSRNFDWIIFLDGDGQHSPEHLPDFIRAIKNDSADVILGNRSSRTERMPFHRQVSNGTTSVMISLCAGKRILDSQCGYRAVRIEKMQNITFESDGFQIESEMLLKLGKNGAEFAHLPVKTVYGQESSSINLVADTLKFINLIIKSLWW